MKHIKLFFSDEYEYMQIKEKCLKRAELYGIDRMVQVYKSLLGSNL